jgi:hypothetical protein
MEKAFVDLHHRTQQCMLAASTELLILVVGLYRTGCSKLKNWKGFLKPNFELLPNWAGWLIV